MPEVAVVIPAYNAEEHLAAAVDSALRQTLAPLQIVIIDDGSTDGTAAVARKFGDKVTLASQENSGVSSARNRGILNSQAEYIAFLDADDLWHPEKLRVQTALLAERKDAPFVYNDIVTFEARPPFQDFTSTVFDSEQVDLFSSLFAHNSVHCSSVLTRRDALARSGLFDVAQRGAEDMDLWLRLAILGKPIRTEVALSALRQHEHRTTKSLQFTLEKLKAFEMMMLRWRSSSEKVKQLQRLACNDAQFLAYAYEEQGRHREAKELFLKTAIWGKQPFRSIVKALQAQVNLTLKK
ncbi:MAG: glycosyltransferase family A protein [Pseudomonadota bacterium]